MKLFYLIKGLKCRVNGNLNLDIKSLCHKDSDVKNNSLFFCLNGRHYKGDEFTLNAIKNGATAIVVEKELIGVSVTQIIVKDTRVAMSLMAARFFGSPAKKLKIIGVTGTNGKTTITHVLADVFSMLGKNVAIVGTNGIVFSGKKYDLGMTTPDPIDMHKYFFEMLKKNVEYVFMEVSAHALDLKKVEGIVFDAMIFTNLTEDHLDYFETMQNYFEAKKKAFLSNRTKLAIVNVDDDYGRELVYRIKTPQITYSICRESDVKASGIVLDGVRQKFFVEDVSFDSALIGEFNISNILSVIALLKHYGYDLNKVSQLINKVSVVDGRFNTIMINERLFIVDYAHTPDGLMNVLKLCRKLKKETSKLICVFGCGGDRETQKRAIMGEISSKIADFSIITSDNPRFEDKFKIARDIESGIINQNYEVVIDRKDAIKRAYEISLSGDIVLVAGKGCENYIDENGIKTPYSDMEEIKKQRGI